MVDQDLLVGWEHPPQPVAAGRAGQPIRPVRTVLSARHLMVPQLVRRGWILAQVRRRWSRQGARSAARPVGRANRLFRAEASREALPVLWVLLTPVRMPLRPMWLIRHPSPRPTRQRRPRRRPICRNPGSRGSFLADAD